MFAAYLRKTNKYFTQFFYSNWLNQVLQHAQKAPFNA